MPARVRRSALLVLASLGAALLAVLVGTPASAHGFSSVVYVDVSAPERGHVRTVLGLEYDLLVVSAADTQRDDALFQDGTTAFDDQDPAEQAAALEAHVDSVLAYVGQRFTVTSGDQGCVPAKDGPVTIDQRDGVPYAFLTLDQSCPAPA